MKSTADIDQLEAIAAAIESELRGIPVEQLIEDAAVIELARKLRALLHKALRRLPAKMAKDDYQPAAVKAAFTLLSGMTARFLWR